MGILSRHKKEKNIAEQFYKSIVQISCPYFSTPIIFNSDGFHHLQFSTSGSEREKPAQLLKFALLPLVPDLIKKSGTVQEYRKQWGRIGRKKSNGSQEMKEMQFWGFVGIIKDEKGDFLRLKVVIRQVGNGNITFWSVMPDTRLKNRHMFPLASTDIEEE